MKRYRGTNKLFFSSRIKEFFSTYKYYLLVSFLLILFGFLTGIFTVNRFSGNISLDNLIDSSLAGFVAGDMSNWTVFFNSILYDGICIMVIVVLNFKPFMMIFTGLILVFKSYIMGFSLMSFIVMFSFMGTMNAIFIILPCDLLCIIILSVLSVLAMKKNWIIHKYGSSSKNIYCNIDYTRIYCLLVILYLLALLIRALLLPVIRFTIIM